MATPARQQRNAPNTVFSRRRNGEADGALFTSLDVVFVVIGTPPLLNRYELPRYPIIIDEPSVFLEGAIFEQVFGKSFDNKK